MRNNKENIPDHIFDLLQTKPFDKLNVVEKGNILLFFSEEEYVEMHSVIGEVQALKQLPSMYSTDKRKQLLMQEFDKKHGAKKQTGLLSYKISLWKAAATFLFFASVGWLLKSGISTEKEVLITQVDTLYIEKSFVSEPVHIYDTFYVREEKRESPTKSVRITTRETPVNIHSEDYILEMGQMQTAPNLPKNNSMKDDSLLNEFSFVTL